MRKIKLAEISIISVLIWIGCIIFSNICYEECDDITMNFIAAGAYGEPSQYLVYSGILLGYFIKFMYALFPSVNCYLWVYLIFNLLAVILLLLAVTHDASYLTTAILSVFINILFAKDIYINLQYTKNAVLYAAVGFAVLAWALGREKTNIIYVIASSVLIALGLSARKDSFLMVLPFGFIVVALVLFRKRAEIRKRGIYLLIPLLLTLVVVSSNFVAFKLNKGWKDFYEWDGIMIQKRDYGNYNFNWNREGYEKAGFSEGDFKLLDEWMWNDTEVFSLDKVRQIQIIGKDTRVSNLRFDPDIFAQTFEEIQKTSTLSVLPYVLLGLLLLTVALCIFSKSYLHLAASLVCVITAYGELYYLLNMRRAIWRAEFGVWFVPIVFLTMFATVLPKPELKSTGKKRILGIVMAVIAVVTLFSWQKNYLDYSRRSYLQVSDSDVERHNEIDSLAKSNGYYVVSVMRMVVGMCGAKNIFEIDKKYDGWFDNILFDGGWLLPSPIGLYSFNKNGVSTSAAALVDRDDVYYWGDGERMGYLYQFLNEHYGPGIEVRDTEVNGVSVWKFFRAQQGNEIKE
ncbi:hypothetical protein SAMN02910451_01592 [Butyrivibrio hungatei]|uniref:Glycosyltransferase RgtA/B/C/D-like domain-containing protein n=1 Tax=Butyrivibrio hungatei TaxID=185008 RepID=A0A1G5DQD1_9FIRM|nr:hypothetical protein [Butyrivibrio hungatei]SCY16864.1 hypothetical protein SAMN02910451_01592 [Butyrivibrio hungatei]